MRITQPGCRAGLTPASPAPPAPPGFYCGLFGWQTEDAMPPGAGVHCYMARIDGRDVAAISSPPPGAAPRAVWDTCIGVESADDAAARVREAGGRVLSGPFGVFDAGRMGVFADPGCGLLRVAARIAPRLGGGQRAWRGELQQPAHRRCRGRAGLLRRRVRLDGNRRRLADVGSAGLRRPSRGAQPRLARGDEADGRARRLRERRGGDLAPRGWPSALERDLRRQRRRRDRRASARARRLGPRRAAKCAVGAIRRPRRSSGASFTASQFVAENR